MAKQPPKRKFVHVYREGLSGNREYYVRSMPSKPKPGNGNGN